ncbi:MAG: hypothetical protein AABY22_27270 [Nanoarchaeota archaeon]
MNIQDISYENAKFLSEKAGDLPIVLGYKQKEYPVFNFNINKPNLEDNRFVLPDCSPFTRKLVKTLENDEVLVGVFYIPENADYPYPLCSQYSVYYISKLNPEKDYGGGICPSQFVFPPISQRDKGIDRKDFEVLQDFVNEGLKLKGFNTQFLKEDSSKYHIYYSRPEFDTPHPGPIGTDFRAPDGVLRRLEAVFETNEVRIEVVSMHERYTELTVENGYFYSIDTFKDGKCINGSRIQSVVNWPPLRERKFGLDYDDYMRIQKRVNETLEFLKFETRFPIVDDGEKYCYMTKDKEKFNSIFVIKKKVMNNNCNQAVDFTKLV